MDEQLKVKLLQLKVHTQDHRNEEKVIIQKSIFKKLKDQRVNYCCTAVQSRDPVVADLICLKIFSSAIRPKLGCV